MSIDSHCHLNNLAYTEDLLTVIDSVKKAALRYIINVGYDIPSSIKALELADQYPDFMFAAVGIHPHDSSSFDDDSYKKIIDLAYHDKVVAIGETGLDFFKNYSTKDEQISAFIKSIDIAKKLKKPVIVHSRDAMDDTIELLKNENIYDISGVMHCFSGTKNDIRKILDLGLYISYAGNITYKNADSLREALQYTPAERVLIETDSPYLAPHPHRGKRNDPSYIPLILEFASKIRNITTQDMERIVLDNFTRLFLNKEYDIPKIAYKIRNSLYINVTNVCTNRCFFCAIDSDIQKVQGHNLKIEKSPTVDQMISAIEKESDYNELVFCGYGEPTMRLKEIIEVGRYIKSKGTRVRLNTNGHGSYINKHDILNDLEDIVDEISISLNGYTKELYNTICNPRFDSAYDEAIRFIKTVRDRKKFIVTVSFVNLPIIDKEATKKFVEDELKVKFRLRDYNLVG